MKISRILFTAAAIGLFAGECLAREFYIQKNQLELTYTSAETGTVNVFRTPVEVRFSDDLKFCYVYVGAFKDNCHLEKHLSTSYAVDTFLVKDQWVQLISHWVAQGLIERSYGDKFMRILEKCKNGNCSYWIMKDIGIDQQIDDELPEAFHLILSAGSDPTKL